MRKLILLTVVISLIFNGCNSTIQNEKLIKCYSEFVMQDGDETTAFYDNHKKFINPYFNVIYLKDTIKATTLMEVNSCGETIGDIRFSNDSIFLLTKNLSELQCNSVVFKKYYYTIYNPNNKKYIIITER